MIPENVRSTFHDMKEKVLGNAQKQEMYAEPTDGTVALPVGLDLHGVEEAERENKGGNASKFRHTAVLGKHILTRMFLYRYMDPACLGLRDT